MILISIGGTELYMSLMQIYTYPFNGPEISTEFIVFVVVFCIQICIDLIDENKE